MLVQFGTALPKMNQPAIPHPHQEPSLLQKPTIPNDKERFLVLIKPNAIERGQVGKMITQLENMYFKIVQLKVMQLTLDFLKQHYAEHVEKPFFPKLAAFMQRTPIIAMVIEGDKGAITRARSILGSSNNTPGSIRGRFAKDATENGLHISEDGKAAKEEIVRIFPEL
jgi:nucleoside-diphosphate kinase